MVIKASLNTLKVRRIKQKPKADIDFWGEAVSKRMRDAGYFPYENAEKLKADKLGSGKILKMIAPYGNDDYAYWVAFKTAGKNLLIIEAAGEAGNFNSSYADDIMKQITLELQE